MPSPTSLRARGAECGSSIRADAARAPRARRPAFSLRTSRDTRRSCSGSASCSLDHYDSFIARVAADAQRPIEYRRSGTLQVARRTSEARGAASAAAPALAQQARLTRFWTAMAPGSLEPALAAGMRAGLLVPQHGYVGVATLMSALVEASRAPRRDVSDAGVVKRIERARMVGERRHVGRNASRPTRWSSPPAAGRAAFRWRRPMPPPVRPVRGQLRASSIRQPAPLACRLGHAGLSGAVDRTGACWWARPSRTSGFDERVTVAGVVSCCERAAELVPAVAHGPLRRGACRAAAGHRRRVADRSALHRQCAACTTRPDTIATACCWRR